MFWSQLRFGEFLVYGEETSSAASRTTAGRVLTAGKGEVSCWNLGFG